MKKQSIMMLAGILLLTGYSASSQLLKKVGKRVESKVKQRIDRKTDKAIDKGLDKVEETATSKDKKPATNAPNNTGTQPAATTFQINSDFDFVPGEKIIFADDFSKDKTGDFPARWNTTGSGETVTINPYPGRWLKVPDNTLSFPETNKTLPENFTVEFDLFYPKGLTRPPVIFGFAVTKNPVKENIKGKKMFCFRIHHTLNLIGYSTTLYSGQETNKKWNANEVAGQITHVSISVNKQRVRLYMNQEKLFDLPRAFDNESLRNSFYFKSGDLMPAPKDGFYIANLRMAESTEDLRSKLIKEGKVSTTGILFNPNSAVVKEQSYGIIREIAAALNEQNDMRISITGHTDSDGDDKTNLALSAKRAEAVKAILVSDFKINAARIETNGKGESAPVISNNTVEGKAANRRVEFIKL